MDHPCAPGPIKPHFKTDLPANPNTDSTANPTYVPPRFKRPQDLATQYHPPENFKIGYFTNNQGRSIRYGHAMAMDISTNLTAENTSLKDIPPKGTPPKNTPHSLMLILPGLGEFGEKYGEFMRERLTRNQSCIFMDWAYQGGSSRLKDTPEHRHSDGFDLDVNDIRTMLSDIIPPLLADHHMPADTPIILFGHSMGGGLALLALSQLEHPPEKPDEGLAQPPLKHVKCAILSSPLTQIRLPVPSYFWAQKIASYYYKRRPTNYVWGGHDWIENDKVNLFAHNILSHNPDRFQIQYSWYKQNPALRIGAVTWGWLYHALAASHKILTPKTSQKIRKPVYIGAAGQDALINPNATKKISTHMKLARFRLFSKARHEIIMENDEIRQEFIQDMDIFIRQHI